MIQKASPHCHPPNASNLFQENERDAGAPRDAQAPVRWESQVLTTSRKDTTMMYKKAASLAVLSSLCAASSAPAQEPTSSQSRCMPANPAHSNDLGRPPASTDWAHSAQ